MLPAQECFAANDLACSDMHLWLIQNQEFLAFEGLSRDDRMRLERLVADYHAGSTPD